MFKLDQIKVIKLCILLSLINISLHLGLNPKGIDIIRIIMGISILISVFLLMLYIFRFNHKLDTNLYFKIMIYTLFSWSIYTIARSISSDTTQMISLFGHFLLGWAWITPFAIYFGFNIFNWIQINNFLIKLLIVGILLTIIIVPLSGEKYTFGIFEWLQFTPILLITYFYQSRFNKNILIFSILAFVVTSFMNSERINIAFLSLAFIFITFEFLRNKKINLLKRTFFILFSISILSLSSFYISDLINKSTNSLNSNKELKSDTRTFLFVELFKDLKEDEVITGRGALGKYYSPFFKHRFTYAKTGGDSYDRSVNEVGYLQMILKGGVIMVIVYLLILIPASFLGIFSSKNIIARMCGYYVFIYIIIWSVSFYPVYSAEFILFWMAVGTCISSKARNTTNEELYQIIKKEK